MGESFTVTYHITDDGWVYSDSFGLAELQGRAGSDVGVEIIDGVRTLVIPEQVDDMDVYIISFHGLEEGFEALYVPDGVGIISPRAFAGCSELRTVRVPDDIYDIAEGSFRGTAIPEERIKELYSLGRMKDEIEWERTLKREREAMEQGKPAWEDMPEEETPEEPGNDIPF